MFEGINKLSSSEKKLQKESQFSFPGKEKKKQIGHHACLQQSEELLPSRFGP